MLATKKQHIDGGYKKQLIDGGYKNEAYGSLNFNLPFTQNSLVR